MLVRNPSPGVRRYDAASMSSVDVNVKRQSPLDGGPTPPDKPLAALPSSKFSELK